MAFQSGIAGASSKIIWCASKQLFALFHVERLLLLVEDLVEFGIAVAQNSFGRAGSEVLMKERVGIDEAAASGEIHRVFAVLVVGVEDAPFGGF